MNDAARKPKIFLWCAPAPGPRAGDVLAYALAEDGTGLARHLSSDARFAKHDLGLTSTNRHDEYAAHYPGGFELVWLEDEQLESDGAFLRAFELNESAAATAA